MGVCPGRKGQAGRGMSMSITAWRYLPYAVYSGAENMAVDEALLLTMAHSQDPQPVLRFYGWMSCDSFLGVCAELS